MSVLILFCVVLFYFMYRVYYCVMEEGDVWWQLDVVVKEFILLDGMEVVVVFVGWVVILFNVEFVEFVVIFEEVDG